MRLFANKAKNQSNYPTRTCANGDDVCQMERPEDQNSATVVIRFATMEGSKRMSSAGRVSVYERLLITKKGERAITQCKRVFRWSDEVRERERQCAASVLFFVRCLGADLIQTYTRMQWLIHQTQKKMDRQLAPPIG